MHRQLWFWLLLVGAAVGVGLASRGPTEPAPGDSSGASVTESGSHAEVGGGGDSSNGTTEADSGEPKPLPRWVWGRVVDADGNAVVDAQVSLWIDAGPFRDSRVAAVARTDRNGRYELRGRAEPDDRYAALSVRKPGYQVAEPERVRLTEAGWYDTHCGFADRYVAAEPALEDRSGVPTIRDAREVGERSEIVLEVGRRIEGRLTLDGGSGELRSDGFARNAIVRGESDRLGWPVEADGRFVAWVATSDAAIGAALAHGGWGKVTVEPVVDNRSEDSEGERERLDRFAVTGVTIPCSDETRLVRVVGEEQPLSGARIWVRPEESSWLATEMVSPTSGEVAIPVGADLHVTHATHLAASVAAEDVESAVVLRAARWITLRLDPALTPPRLYGGAPRTTLDRVGRGFRSRPVPRDQRGCNLTIDEFLPRFVEWPRGVGHFDCGRITLDPGTWIDVSVVDQEGQPVAGAVLSVWSGSQGGATDASGQVRFGPLASGVVGFTVSALGYREESVSIPTNEVTTVRVTLQALAAVSFTVRDQRGRPVEAGLSTLNSTYQSSADAEGRVKRAELPAGQEITLRVWGPRHQSTELYVSPLLPGELRELGVVTLHRLPSVDITVVNSDGVPVEAAQVALLSSQQRYGPIERTGEDGTATVEGLAPAKYRVSVIPYSEDGPPTLSLVTVPPEVDRVELLVELAAPRQVGLTVVDDRGDPSAGVDVRHVHLETDASRSAKTNESGAATLTGLGEGTWLLEVSDGRRTVTLTGDSIEELPSRVVLPITPALKVRVENELSSTFPDLVLLVDGREAARASLSGDQIATFAIGPGDEEVTFEFGDELRSGVYRIVMPAEGSDVELSVMLTPVEVRERVECVLVDSEGQPFRDAQILVSEEWVASVDAMGRAQVDAVELNGPLSVVRNSVVWATVEDPLSQEEKGQLEIIVSRPGTVRVSLVESGRTVDLDGGLSLEIRPADGRSRAVIPRFETVGNWLQCRVSPGRWVLEVRWLSSVLETQELEVLSDHVIDRTVEVPASFEVFGTVRANEMPELLLWRSSVDVGGRVSMVVDPDGRYRGRLRAAGSYYAGVDGFSEVAVEVTGPGRFDLDLSARIAGRVVGLQPLGGRRRGLLGGARAHARFDLDDSGRFEIPPLEGGTYLWVIRGPLGYRRGWIDLRGDERDLEIVVPELIEASVAVRGPRFGQELEFMDVRAGMLCTSAERADTSSSRSDGASRAWLSKDADHWFVFETTFGGFARLDPSSDGTVQEIELMPAGFLDGIETYGLGDTIEVQPLTGAFPCSVRMLPYVVVLPVGSYVIRGEYPAPWETVVEVRAGETTTVNPSARLR